MEHYQKEFRCSVCKRELIADIISIGIQHRTIEVITCKKCAIKVGGNIMENKVEDLDLTPAPKGKDK